MTTIPVPEETPAESQPPENGKPQDSESQDSESQDSKSQSGKHIELHLPSVLGYEKIARRAAEAVAEQMDFESDRIEDLKTAVAEACMNAIEHGNKLDATMRVTVMMTIQATKLEVRVADVGQDPFPEELPEPGTNDRSWGMFFIKHLVDEVEVMRMPEGGNQVRMVIYLSPEGQSTGDTLADGAKSDSAKADSAPAGDKPVTAGKPAAAPPSQALQKVEPKPSAIQPVKPKPSAIQPIGAVPAVPPPPSSPDAGSTSASDDETPPQES